MPSYSTQRLLATSILALGLICSAGCPSIPFAHTNLYRPVSDWESAEFKRADHKVYPNDVRSDIDRYRQVTVAWAGIIKDITFEATEDRVLVTFLVEHHFFDWLEDHSIQKEIFFLSPRGEGLFKTVWRIKKSADLDELKRAAMPGDMLVVYGNPTHVAGEIVYLDCTYVRPFPRRLYRTDEMDYGRTDDPVRYMKVPQ